MNNSTVISWITSSDYPAILQYQLEFEGGHCGTRELVLVNVTHSGHSVSVDVSEISLLNRGANYTVRIKALNAFVGGGWSDGVSLQTERSSKLCSGLCTLGPTVLSKLLDKISQYSNIKTGKVNLLFNFFLLCLPSLLIISRLPPPPPRSHRHSRECQSSSNGQLCPGDVE